MELQKLDAIPALINKGIDAWTEAGVVVCQHLDHAGRHLKDIAEETKVPISVLVQLERIGRRQVLPWLLISDAPAARAMERLPYSEQVRLETESIPLLLENGETLMVEPKGLLKNQVKQVFASGHVRSIGEQRAWQEDKKKNYAPPTNYDPYTIAKGRIIFHQPCEISRVTLARILAEMQ